MAPKYKVTEPSSFLTNGDLWLLTLGKAWSVCNIDRVCGSYKTTDQKSLAGASAPCPACNQPLGLGRDPAAGQLDEAREVADEAPEGSGVSCATCHLPRVEHRYADYGFRLALTLTPLRADNP